jgi:RNA polymerase sigma factor (sigma-70 family)
MSNNSATKADEDLMQAYQAGDPGAFDVLYERHSGRVFGYLIRRIQKKKEVEDLLQEVFFKLHRSKHLYNGQLPFSPWLFTITRSVLLDYAKKMNREELTDVNEIDKMASLEPQKVDHPLESLVSTLPPSQAEAIHLRIFDDKSFEEIATQLSTSPQNARQLFSRGLKAIRQVVERRGK